MRVRKKILDFYINSSIHVALAVVSLTIITYLHLNIPIEKNLLLFIFFGTVTGYNFVKYATVAGLHHRSLADSLKTIQIFSFISFMGLVITAFYVRDNLLLWAGCFGLITLLYALPVFSRSRNLRSISGLKIYIIALVCAGVTVVLPGTSAENPLFGTLMLEFLQRFVLVIAWILPFEIRDLKYDLQQLGTIPQRVGITWTKILGYSLLGSAVILDILKNSSTQNSLIALMIMVIVSGVFIWRSQENQSRYFASFWVEAIPIMWLIVLVFLRGG